MYGETMEQWEEKYPYIEYKDEDGNTLLSCPNAPICDDDEDGDCFTLHEHLMRVDENGIVVTRHLSLVGVFSTHEKALKAANILRKDITCYPISYSIENVKKDVFCSSTQEYEV